MSRPIPMDVKLERKFNARHYKTILRYILCHTFIFRRNKNFLIR